MSELDKKAVKTAFDAYRNFGWQTPQGMEKAIRAYLAAAPAPRAPVAVKPLEWADEPTGSMFSAEFYYIRREDGRFYTYLLDAILAETPTAAKAKAAAQADYEQRILSALISSPTRAADNFEGEI